MTVLPSAHSLRALIAASLIAVPGLAMAQEAAPDAHSEEAAPAADLPAITVSEVKRVRLTDRVIASGLVDAIEQVQVQPLVEGQPIDELLADVGDTVEEGQVLARLSESTLELQLSQLAANRASTEAQIAQAEASLVQATANAEEAERVARRNAELVEAGSVPQAQADQSAAAAESARAAVRVSEQGIASARAQLELVDAQIENAELQLSRTEVRAPVGGLVVARNAQIGAIASATGQAMFTIVREGAMEMRADVSEQDLLRLDEGQPATMQAMQGSDVIPGKVRLVEPAIDPQTRLGVARIQIDDPTRAVKGMFLTAEVTVSEQESPAVPVTAVGTGSDGSTVMRVRDGVAERVSVTTGIRDGGLIGIVDGLAEGDLVVTKAGAFVRDGDRINPVQDELEVAQGGQVEED
ncbi:efflux RND transporter periplasmic adaptor subunit [Rubellimicrobium rubrum]|uniref:Efflux RND transporter periplasmic adaptor subunit n=1 Tax=Rubellimicrobium rubrum TaxID=2585369 RepID=A0A5C4N4Q0_9RHOB|nr:efflux RND transporter periplasmic adaptor subunit [Rubellimicrobium rubrum]TNC51988.1 efflux RND transporter periplasmic adaptor subunit [Rubellimicrobium rubrum]